MPMIQDTKPIQSQQKPVSSGSTVEVKNKEILLGLKKKHLLVIAAVLLILGLLILYLFFIRGNYKSETDKTPVVTVTSERISTKSASKSAGNFTKEEPKDVKEPSVNINKGYEMNVLVIKYFPLTSNGQNIDINVTGDVDGFFSVIKQKTVAITKNLVTALEESSRYLGYKDPKSESSLKYTIVDTVEHKKAFLIEPGTTNKPNYNKVMKDHNICNYVGSKKVSEVWILAYQGPGPQLGISESKMSGPFGDISNSYRSNDMPICKSTYRSLYLQLSKRNC